MSADGRRIGNQSRFVHACMRQPCHVVLFHLPLPPSLGGQLEDSEDAQQAQHTEHAGLAAIGALQHSAAPACSVQRGRHGTAASANVQLLRCAAAGPLGGAWSQPCCVEHALLGIGHWPLAAPATQRGCQAASAVVVPAFVATPMHKHKPHKPASSLPTKRGGPVLWACCSPAWRAPHTTARWPRCQ